MSAAIPAPARKRTFDDELMASLLAEWVAAPDRHPRRAALRTRLIVGYLPLARIIAGRYANGHEDRQDVEQVAVVGLIQALDRFSLDRGDDFLSYAVPTITGVVRRHLRDRTSTIRVPRRVAELRSAVYVATVELEQALGREPGAAELARWLDSDEAEVRAVRGIAAWGRCESLNEPVGGTGADHDPRLCTSASGHGSVVELRLELGPLLARLPEREQRILMMRFVADLTQQEIARRLKTSQTTVSRSISRSLASLRRGVSGPPGDC